MSKSGKLNKKTKQKIQVFCYPDERRTKQFIKFQSKCNNMCNNTY